MAEPGQLLRRLLIGVGAVVVLLAGVTVAADAPIRGAVQDAAAAKLAAELSSPTKPTVVIEGWPFLVCVATGFPRVQVSAPSLTATANSTTVTLERPDLSATDLRVGTRQVTASSVAGTVVLSYPELSAQSGGTVTFQGGGRVQYQGRVTIDGLLLPATASGIPSFDAAAQTLGITDVRVAVVGVAVPSVPLNALVAVLAPPVHLELPFGLQVSEVTPTEAGLTLGVSGTDVAIPYD